VEKRFPPVTVWAGANGPGLARLEVAASGLKTSTIGSERLSNTSVTAFYEDQSGDMWFGQLEGATWYRRKESLFTALASLPNAPAGFRSMTITFINEDRNGMLWFGTYASGLLKFDRSAGAFTRYVHIPGNPNGLSDNNVISFHEDNEGTLWFGTYRGLNRFDPSKEAFRIFTTANGLPNDVIYGILEDDHGNLWLSSNKGLTSFNRKSLQTVSYDIGDGLQSNEFNQGASFKARDGTMYFGGINGFNKFHPDSISTNPNIPVVVFTDFKIFNKTVEPGLGEERILGPINTIRELHLSHDDAVLTFEFAALEFTAPQRNRYAYYMEGFESGWNEAGEKTEATYTNLDPAEYVFRVKASNNDGVWNEQGVSLRIVIAPPWWMTWWFQGLVVVGFLSVGPIIYVRRVSGLRKEHALQQDISRRLIESQEMERKRIASELHDGLGQDLLIISNRAQMARDKTKSSEWTEEQLKEIAETATQAIQDVRTIAHDLRPYQIDRIGLTKGIESIFKNLSGSTGIQIQGEIDHIDGFFPTEHEIHVFRVVQEAVNNMIKHSHATEAGVTIKKQDDHILMTIWDKGKGFDTSVIGTARAQGHGFGLSGILERVRIVGGTANVISSAGKGTIIEVRFPIAGTLA
jgi:signal transduction histidine kinase